MNTYGNGPIFDSIDAIQRWAFDKLLNHGHSSAPRGIRTQEVLGYTFTLTRPRARVIQAPARRWSFPLAIGEFCWHISASNDVRSLEYYAPRWQKFAAKDQTIRGSCYGRRIFYPDASGNSRWEKLIDLLEHDPSSRRGVIDLCDSHVLSPDELDVSCTSTLQMLAREGRLHLIVQMRSNDVVWGLPYDIFLFTMLQEMLALRLGLGLGVYIHSVGSLHLYEKHFKLAENVLSDPPPNTIEMPKMTSISSLNSFIEAERKIRRGDPRPPLDLYWETLALALEDFSKSRKLSSNT